MSENEFGGNRKKQQPEGSEQPPGCERSIEVVSNLPSTLNQSARSVVGSGPLSASIELTIFLVPDDEKVAPDAALEKFLHGVTAWPLSTVIPVVGHRRLYQYAFLHVVRTYRQQSIKMADPASALIEYELMGAHGPLGSTEYAYLRVARIVPEWSLTGADISGAAGLFTSPASRASRKA